MNKKIKGPITTVWHLLVMWWPREASYFHNNVVEEWRQEQGFYLRFTIERVGGGMGRQVPWHTYRGQMTPLWNQLIPSSFTWISRFEQGFLMLHQAVDPSAWSPGVHPSIACQLYERTVLCLRQSQTGFCYVQPETCWQGWMRTNCETQNKSLEFVQEIP